MQDGNLVITRAEAKKIGVKNYYNGKKCRHEHRALRVTKTGACHECLKAQRVRDKEKKHKKMGHMRDLIRKKEWGWIKFIVHKDDRDILLDCAKKLTNDRLTNGDY